MGGRGVVDVVGQGLTTVTLDYASGDRILVETAIPGTRGCIPGPTHRPLPRAILDLPEIDP